MDSGGAKAGFGHESLLAEATSGRWPALAGKGGLSEAAASFLRQAAFEAASDDLDGLSAGDLVCLLDEFWAWVGQRSTAREVRIYAGVGADGRALDRHILEIQGLDGPFLVDSVLGELSANGLTPRAMIHPIVMIARDAEGRRIDGAGVGESLIQVHLAPLGPRQAAALADGVRATLADVSAATADFLALKKRMVDVADELETTTVGPPAAMREESVRFLRWLASDRFIFLGARDYRYPRDDRGDYVRAEPNMLDGSGLGILRDMSRFVLRRDDEAAVIADQARRIIEEPLPIVVAKSSYASRVHRRAQADYVGVKRYATDGQAIGETRFIGLFTADAYNEPTREIPLLAPKTEQVLSRAGAPKGSHNERVLRNILETYPRDELFQISDDDLYDTALGILHLNDRPRPRLFVRRDRFDRFVSALAFVPKERFNSQLRIAIGEVLTRAYGGHIAAFYPELRDEPLARIRFLVQEIDRSRAAPDLSALEREITALTRTWQDGFLEVARASPGLDAQARADLCERFANAFNAGYRERFGPAEGVSDALEILKAGAHETVRVRSYRSDGSRPDQFNARIYSRGAPLPLSSVLPVLEHMGLFVESEAPFEVRLGGDLVVIHDLAMRSRDGAAIEFDAVQAVFEEAFAAIWTGRADDDGFNALILKLGVGWREASLIRALARFRTQTGLDPAQSLQEAALAEHPEITRLILALFRVRFDPDLPEGLPERKAWAERLVAQIDAALEKVATADADRALRRIARLVEAILRTNYYQRGADGAPARYMSFKIASGELVDLPLPKPYREIWVWSPEVEGVHLRFGPVARGGLRWSDRRDDFRVEVLDLVKAQQVKNSIIVPVGAKGGFFPKTLPPRSEREAYAEAGKSAYRSFLRALLDITDNYVETGVTAPARVVRWDGDDPYLVVAADKGTATFSDVANGIAAEYGFWLGDAFASGGSVGYDHKEMGITARGAWEAVKRHFREMGRDIQNEDFTVIGVGDMSGDVFGNGMLLSKHIRLIAAFDHRDIFIDPNPDAAISFAERRRLFEKPGSSWKDYDPALISAGGGVFSRNQKAIQLTGEIKALTGLPGVAASPAELMHALLLAECDLLWFGGIGAYVKAARETHADAGDKANDSIRVDAEALRAKVIGEGANLGVTQAGRIAFARRGGRINTDAVDNSAGVDTSDHEVNIKILLAEAQRQGLLTAAERNPLLEAMTDDVARLVLADNYDQTLALTLAEASGAADLDAHERFIERLENSGKLNRAVEGLPSAEEIRALRERGLGLTRPELAKLVAYAKIDLFDALVASPTPDDPHFAATLEAYFPPQLARFAPAMGAHRLKREIIATALADDVVNLGGPTFVERIRETARVDAPTIAAAFEAALKIFRLDEIAERINGLDAKAPAALQTTLYQDLGSALRRIVIYVARHGLRGSLAETIAAYRPSFDAQQAHVWETLTPNERSRTDQRIAAHVAAGAPEDLARDIVALAPLVSALDVADLSRREPPRTLPVAHVYRQVGAAFRFDRLRGAAQAMSLAQHWDRLALRRTVEQLFEDQRALAAHAVNAIPTAPANAAEAEASVAAWAASLGQSALVAQAALEELEAGGGWTFAKVVIAAAELRALTTALSR
jgi:glutamate dehydrogenase